MTRIWSEFRIYAVITQFVNNKDASSNLPAFDVLVTLQNDVTRSRNCSRSNILKWMANAKFAHRASNSVCIRETCCTCTYHRKPNAVIMMTSVGKTFLTEIRVRPKDPRPVVAALAGRHLNIKDHVAKWPLRRRRSPFCCRMIYRNGAADYGDPIWQ